MPNDQRLTFTVQNGRLRYRNFAGRPTPWNKQGGDRNFTIELDQEVAEQMAADGWNVKIADPREEGDEPTPRIDVKVKFDKMPPRIVCITSNSRFDMNEDTVELLDGMDISSVDMIANASFYDVNGKRGISAYLKKLVVVVEEDELDRKWGLNQVPDHESEEAMP